jgi:hypothetical protein
MTKYKFNLKVMGSIDARNQEEAMQKVKDSKLSKYPDSTMELEEEEVLNYFG